MPFSGDRLQTFSWIPNDQTRRFTLFILFGDESREHPSHVGFGRACPRLQFFQQPFASQHSFKRDENVPAETFYPSVFTSAKAVRVCSLCLKIAEQSWINPSKIHF